MRVLLVEGIHPISKDKLEVEGFDVDFWTHAPSEKELLAHLPRYEVLGIRSKTELTKNVLLASSHLVCVGAFCIGTNQIDLDQASSLGIPVFNAPHSNTRSVAEMVVAEMIVLSRQLGDRNTKAHQGEWLKTASGAHEVRGKTLGIVGYGHIGSQLSVLAESLGLQVLFFDVVKKLPLGNAKNCASLEELLQLSDFVSLHVPETPETKNLITEKELRLMKKGSFLINASRGTVVDLEALKIYLLHGHLAGAAIDVFPLEPSSNKEKFVSPLQGVPNVILTPHIGGSTEEAQLAIGLEVVESFRKYLRIGSTQGAVNFPNVDLPPRPKALRILNVHKNEPGVLGEINGMVSRAKANIQAQYLSTDDKIGYLVMDVEISEAEDLAKQIQSCSRSLRTRLIRP